MAFNRGGTLGCPCGGCDERSAACHDRCDKFKAWRVKVDARRQKEREYNASNNTMSEAKRKELWKRKRYSVQGYCNNSTKLK